MKHRPYLIPLLFILAHSACTPYHASPTPTPVVTRTPTLIAGTSTSLPTRTPEPGVTMTPRPTLEPAQAEETIRSLLREPIRCSAPCFWDIKPGKTTIAEARQIFSHLGLPLQLTLEQDNKQFFAITHDLEAGPSLEIILTIESGIVQNLRVTIIPEKQTRGSARQWLAYSPETLLRRYGQPTSVDFFADWGPSPAYDMTTYFDTVDLIVEYGSHNITGGTDSAPQVCPLTDQIDAVRLWLGKQPVDPPDRLVPLESATGMTMEQFSSLMTGTPDKACLNLNKQYFP
jgi:hypothetical protein